MAKELKIERIFEAPVETVWKYWSEPEYFKKWHGPRMFSCPVSKIDFRVGGKYLHCMHGEVGLPPEMVGKDFWSTGIYKEIVPLRKIVATDSFADEDGNVVSAEQYGMKDFPMEMEVTVEFEALEGDKTKMTLIHRGVEVVDEKMIKDMEQGWGESLDKLGEQLKK